jgi:WD40 repeat protein
MCIVQQNPFIIAFGTIGGAIKDFDMKSKKLVRTSAKRHKKAITSLSSHGKYLLSCSSEDNLIIVYDYAK